MPPSSADSTRCSNKYWVDEIYGALIVTPVLLVSRYVLKGLIDTGVIGGALMALGYTAQGFGAIVQRVQSGNIRSYAGWLALGRSCPADRLPILDSAHFSSTEITKD